MQDTTTNTLEGIWIDIEILKDQNLSLQEKFVLAIIKALDKGKGCYASNRYFADLLNVTSKRASDIIRSLIIKEYVVSEIENFYKRTLRIVVPNESPEEIEEEKTTEQSQEAMSPSKQKRIIIDGRDITDWPRESIERVLKYVPNFKEKIQHLKLKLIEVPSEWQGITQLAFRG